MIYGDKKLLTEISVLPDKILSLPSIYKALGEEADGGARCLLKKPFTGRGAK